MFLVSTVVECNVNNNQTNSTRLLNVLQRQQEYHNASKLASLELPFDLGRRTLDRLTREWHMQCTSLVGLITHVSIDTLTIRTRENGTTRIKLACVYTTNIWKAAFLRKHPLEPLTYK